MLDTFKEFLDHRYWESYADEFEEDSPTAFYNQFKEFKIQSQFTFMKYETVFIMAPVLVHTDHKNISSTVAELESQAKLSLTDTPNINIMETEILVSRVHNPIVHKIRKNEVV